MKAKNTLRLPQYRVLVALKPKGGRFPVATRTDLAVKAGFKAGSGTINRALHGIAKGSSSGEPFPGLLELGYVKTLSLPLDGGAVEVNYQATKAGVKAMQAFARDHSDSVKRKVRAAKSSTNKRYA